MKKITGLIRYSLLHNGKLCKLIILVHSMLFFNSRIFSQNLSDTIIIKGRVLNENGAEELPGATIRLVNSKIIRTSTFDGKFDIRLNKPIQSVLGDTLKVEYSGYFPYKLFIDSSVQKRLSNLKIRLKLDTTLKENIEVITISEPYPKLKPSLLSLIDSSISTKSILTIMDSSLYNYQLKKWEFKISSDYNEPEITLSFPVLNSTKDTLIFWKGSSQAWCTIQLGPKKIAPGQTAEMKIHFDLMPLRNGRTKYDNRLGLKFANSKHEMWLLYLMYFEK